MARPNVPKFGTWDANSNGPTYTAVFDHARAGKGGKPLYPNDSADHEASLGPPAPPHRSNDRPPPPRGRPANSNNDQGGGDEAPVARPRHERRSSREDMDVRRSSDPPARRPPVGNGGEGRYAGRGGSMPSEPPPRRAVVDRDGSNHSERGNNEGSGHNPERSPGHPYSNAARRESGRGSASPAWDRKGRQPSGDEGSVFAPGTPKNNSRLRQGASRPEEPPAKGGALPKFGAWDVKDPSSGDGFTMIFQKASTERKEGGPVHIPRLNTDSPARNEGDYHQKQGQPNASRKKQSPDCGCIIL